MSGADLYAQVALDRSSHALPEPLTYRVPPQLAAAVAPGTLVHVPLGGARAIGVVAGFGPRPAGIRVIKEIAGIATPDFRIPPDVMALAQWVADFYLCSLGEALGPASFIGFNDLAPPRARGLRIAEGADAAVRDAKQAALLARIREVAGEAAVPSQAWVAATLGIPVGRVKALLDKGLLVPTGELAPPRACVPAHDPPHDLTEEQRAALDAILPAVRAPRFQPFLLHGVTGSGKTEVFLRAIAEVLAPGRTALVLVPEIALTPQTVARFERRFREPVGVCHSQLQRPEKLALALHLREGRIRIVIGARSAVFAPLPNLGLVVVDEEHEGSYKQGETPRYHGRDVAIMRARNAGVPVILASATPSLESYENARAGKYTLLELRSRPGSTPMPPVRLVDLAAEARAVADDGMPGLVSATLKAAIAERLERGEQSILLLNRRGFSNFLMCPQCKWVAKCGEDDVALTVHRRARRGEDEDPQLDLFGPARVLQDGELRCHFCGTRSAIPKACPQCGDLGLVALGSGTQRVELELRAAFPDARQLRMDLDAIGGRRAFLDAWGKMVSGEAQIILGTQMIAKGLHLERVTLVGVVLADVGLFQPDFRAEERTFSLLCQVAGRSGRALPGEVIFQTFMPRHDAIRFATAHDYLGFFEHERQRRAALRFPPIQRLVALTISDDELDRARQVSHELGGILRRLAAAGAYDGAAVRGPLAAPIARLGGRWRERILLRGPKVTALGRLYRDALADPQWRLPPTARLTADVDPQDLL
jgi:primosomal protein N' (replication factor Y)